MRFLFLILWRDEVKLVSDQSVLLLRACCRALRSGRVQSIGMEVHGGVASLFVHRGSLLLCAASAHSLNGPHPSAVCLPVRFLLCCETFC